MNKSNLDLDSDDHGKPRQQVKDSTAMCAGVRRKVGTGLGVLGTRAITETAATGDRNCHVHIIT